MLPGRTPFAALHHRDYRVLWIGLAFSAVGMQFTTVAMAWQIYELTNSAFQVGLLGLARGVPQAALEKVYAPLGFDIGSQTVPEIAVSIVAELIACRNRGATIPEARVNVRI